jgi:energy-converting hydrogenase A subunit M
MKYKFELKEKDWSKRLTEEEVGILAAWNEEYDLQEKQSSDLPKDEDIHKKIAEKYNISMEDVKKILMKQLGWMY